MPIKFPCVHCKQRLSVSSRKAGQRAKCPNCRREIEVPAGTTEQQVKPAASESDASDSPSDPFAQFAVYDTDTEWVYEHDEVPAPADDQPSEQVDYDKLAVPRRIVYAQGILLGVVALIGFVFGLLMGHLTTGGPVEVSSRPCTIRGVVRYTNRQNRNLPDGGSVVVVVPRHVRPEPTGKVAISEIRPTASVLSPASPAVQKIRALGGAVTLVAADGSFEIRVPDRGEYYVLVLSRHQTPLSDARAIRGDVGQVGRYFTPADELLVDYRYQWRSESVHKDRTLQIMF